ncbi:hypothetical protein B484DRAFT_410648, partial [Ochromonadaceae sp. CCMP2298]
VIFESASLAWKQVAGMMSFMIFLVFLFAILLYEVELGSPCFVGDAGCTVPADTVEGGRVLINKAGDITSFGNVFYGIWYTFVTITSTG